MPDLRRAAEVARTSWPCHTSLNHPRVRRPRAPDTVAETCRASAVWGRRAALHTSEDRDRRRGAVVLPCAPAECHLVGRTRRSGRQQAELARHAQIVTRRAML